jgi:membrane fusion protein (multidrug efflux system)
LLATGAAVALVLLGLFGGWEYLHRGDESTDDAHVEADVVAVAPRVGGPIAEVLVPEDAPVKAGQAGAGEDRLGRAARRGAARGALGVRDRAHPLTWGAAENASRSGARKRSAGPKARAGDDGSDAGAGAARPPLPSHGVMTGKQNAPSGGAVGERGLPSSPTSS